MIKIVKMLKTDFPTLTLQDPKCQIVSQIVPAMPLGSNLATPRGWIVSIDLQLEKLKKSSSLKPLGPQL